MSVTSLKDMNILILGHAGHGKDTVCAMLEEALDLSYCSSSWYAVKIPEIKKQIYDSIGIDYANIIAAYDDRSNHREVWFKAIQSYGKRHGKHKLAFKLLSVFNIYNGMRNKEELAACLDVNLFDLILWVDRSDLVEDEPETSFNIEFNPDNMIKINNNTNTNLAALEAETAIKKMLATGSKD